MTVRAIFVRNQRSTSVIQYKILIIDIFDIILNILRDEIRNSKRLMIILFTGWECRELSRNIKIIDAKTLVGAIESAGRHERRVARSGVGIGLLLYVVYIFIAWSEQ